MLKLLQASKPRRSPRGYPARQHAEKDILPGWSCSWSGLVDNEFDGTGVSVVMLKADRK